MMGAHLTHNFADVLESIRQGTRSFQKPLTQFYGYMLRRTELTFRTLGKKGAGRFRGISWAWFAPIRTKSGKLLPAEGRRLRTSFVKRDAMREARGMELKKHPPEHYVQASSRLLVDTGWLKQAALAKYSVTDFVLEADTPVPYADAQQAMRPFAFFEAEDINVLRNMIIKHFVE
jgi:hypothetical protein